MVCALLRLILKCSLGEPDSYNRAMNINVTAFTLGPRVLQCMVLTFSAVDSGIMNINKEVSKVIP